MLLLSWDMLFLSWEWMHRWHPVYPAHVSELECFPWVRTRVTRLQKKGLTTWRHGHWADRYSGLSYQGLRRVATIRTTYVRVLTKTWDKAGHRLNTHVDQNPG